MMVIKISFIVIAIAKMSKAMSKSSNMHKFKSLNEKVTIK